MAPVRTVGILGGTGPAGRGLGTRLAAAGFEVVLGSRVQERAAEAAAALVAQGLSGVTGASNEAAASASLVVVATPWDGAIATARELRGALSGKVVVSMVNALARFGTEFHALVPVRGSLAATLQAVLPEARVAAAFHHLPAGPLADLSQPIEADVLVCADDREAAETTIAMTDQMEGLRGVYAGSLASANALETLTAVLLNVNRRYKTHASLRLTGINPER